jgi:hypothetical protein
MVQLDANRMQLARRIRLTAHRAWTKKRLRDVVEMLVLTAARL